MKRVGPVVVLVLGCFTGCTGHEDPSTPPPPIEAPPEAQAPEPEPEPEPEPPAPSSAELVRVSVASVNLRDDCPPAQPSEQALGAAAKGDSYRIEPDCVQSVVQLAIESEAAVETSFSVRAVRVQRAGGDAPLATMTAREPTIWDDAEYGPWNQRIPAGDSLNVSYSLGASDWSTVSGATAYGLFVVVLDVVVDGEVRTIVSPVVDKEPKETMVT